MRDPNSRPGPSETTSGGRGDATLQRLVDGAQATFAERGYAAANIHEICARAKVGIGTFYAHFEHKRELLQHVMVERAPLLIAQLSPADLVDTARIAAWLSAAFDDPNTTGLWRAWHEAVLEEPELIPFHSTWYGESLARLSTMVTEARARLAPEHDRADAAVVAWSILTLARELAIHDRVGAPEIDELAQLIRQLVVSAR